MQFLLSLFAATVLAAETVLSPLADDALVAPPQAPTVSFGQLTTSVVPPQPEGQVLGAVVEEPAQVTPLQGVTLQAAPATKKNHYTIALLGDSMVDTLGPDFPALKDKLRALYPATSFTILNFGVGGTNIDYGLERVTNSYTYLSNPVPSVVSQRPDIVVVESFGYNPYSFDEGAIDKHWLAMAKVVDILKANIPGVKIVIAATIAPDAATFGDGAPGVAFAAQDKWERVDVIKKYLDNAVKFAASQKLPLADAFHPSLDGDGNGKDVYINAGDHIHYSDAGRALVAQKIADTIVANKLLE
ncbi:hypothetical protein A3A64_02460 [Candidatus Gottesmanbacteria bacterium RIFCSPLOWO2_01_FULL_48_11]|uniref:SGNH hydrolase-type esterase domain-containing protein n=2 Tax=Candidatus Gottesmaniibacteriota TaxID=1752720 RepID=A0A0G1TZA8_9BACT|nr:MAG: hypothetical protein UY16_C0038G0006 [Candidatus Gottesmanbacteria bacterium GW2011_GWA2_47_9]OGG27907.1 MAG: hypothetical protein A3A64_02460 [Candidatus Gottesmanbacteria bacterium RIFCSPLOWO2_01_FULL_48_11]